MTPGWPIVGINGGGGLDGSGSGCALMVGVVGGGGGGGGMMGAEGDRSPLG